MNKFMSKLAALIALTVGVVASAHAELPAAATAGLAEINTGIGDAADAAWPLISAALIAGVIIKLVKRFTNKV